MNVAITTWHSGPNAGTFFQLYGLYKYVEYKGHHVEVIDYRHTESDLIARGWYYFASQPFALLKRKIERKKSAKQYEVMESKFHDQIKLRDERFKEMYSWMNFLEYN